MAFQTKGRDPLFDSSMQEAIEKRSKELIGIALIALGAAMAAMLLSYSPSDPSWMSASDAPVQNWLGRFGASIAAPIVMVIGIGGWAMALLALVWGTRFALHRVDEGRVGRLIFAPVFIALVSVYGGTLTPGADWPHAFGLGGLFGDTVLGAMLGLLPMSLSAGVKLMSLVLGVSSVVVGLYVMGFTLGELRQAFKLVLVGIVLAYDVVLKLLGRGAHSTMRAAGSAANRAQERGRARIERHRSRQAARAEARHDTVAYSSDDWDDGDWNQQELWEDQPYDERLVEDDNYAAYQEHDPAYAADPHADYYEPEYEAEPEFEPAPEPKPRLLGRLIRRPEPQLPPEELVEQTPVAHLPEETQGGGDEDARIRAKIANAVRSRARMTPSGRGNAEPTGSALPRQGLRARGPKPLIFNPNPIPAEPPVTAARPAPVELPPEPPLTASRAAHAAPAAYQAEAPMAEVADYDDQDFAAEHFAEHYDTGYDAGSGAGHVAGYGAEYHDDYAEDHGAEAGGWQPEVPARQAPAPQPAPRPAPVARAAMPEPSQRNAEQKVHAPERRSLAEATATRVIQRDPVPAVGLDDGYDHDADGHDDFDGDESPFGADYGAPAPGVADHPHTLPFTGEEEDGGDMRLPSVEPRKVVQHGARKPVQPSSRARAEAQPVLGFDPEEAKYELPPLNLLTNPDNIQRHVLSDEALEENARMLESVLDDYGVKGEIVSVRPGPVVTMYELEPAPGLKASRVIGLSDDIARSMSALSARVSTVPGRSVIGIELPNDNREMVVLREILAARDFGDSHMKLPLALGKDIGGEPMVANLAKMPHLLIAGTTGSGKSVAINTMILSLLYRLTPEECRLIMIDPKMLELSVYDGIPHLLSPVVTDPKKAVVALKWVVAEMEDRYRKMSKMGVRNIDGYNSRVQDTLNKGEMFSRTVQTGFDDDTGEPVFETEEIQPEKMPYIVVIVDEMADLMMVAGKEIEACIQRLAQMARASGIHLIMATQRPSVDVITGTIKANFPTRISFQVTSKIDSRTILGEMGAEQLLGMGDMLYMAGGAKITRCHGPFVSDEEVEEIVNYLKAYGPPDYVGGVVEGPDDERAEDIDAVLGLNTGGNTNGEDALYDQAVAIVIKDRKCSTSYIQRKLAIGYNKAARLVEQMEDEGVVSAANHVGKREILVPEQ